ncbi:MAG: DUF4358 domain-containing protein [Oscillospiraceae bacterium]|jgi:hypothetical protein|nr:DUF4358 domain-containing protein [Oscillospiraceae bacterium]
MKKRVCACLLACLLCLSGCGREPEEASGWTALQMARAILASQGAAEAVTELDGADFAAYAGQCYQLDPRQVEDGAVLAAGGVSALEIAVLRLTEDGAQAAEALEDYIAARAGAFTGYAPEQAAILAHSTAVSRGRYAALLICSDPAEARAAFNACFEGPPAEEPPVPLAPRPQEPPVSGEEEQDGGWRYDRQRLLSAWEEGGTGLADRDQVILQSCRDLLGEIITEEMSDYEKELAVHDWMIAWAEYDQAALSSLPGAQPTPDSDNPYGFFTGRAAICTGYTSTFQLLMDLLDIECVTVEGTAYNGTEDHAWNMVRLDGDWYCVDVTWDDPVSSTPVSPAAAHMYFNVTSDFMRQFGHQWDEEAVPAAEAGAWAWRG